MFVPNLSGILMKVQEESITRYQFEIWFDYTRQAINTIAEGAMVAVANFAGNDVEVHYSILEITGILPIHYALGSDTSGYPGFIVEAARNAGQDWMTQDAVSTEDTTKIRCVAIPTNLEIVETPLLSNNREPIIQEESNLPMVGHPVQLLNTEMTERIVNRALDLRRDNVIQIGSLVRSQEVDVYLQVEGLIKVHFGIFGFTGAGKSNLLSTLIRKLVNESDEPIKIVIFDLMSEYTGLLIDLLVELDHARIINLGAQTVPQSVLEHLKNRQDNVLLERAARDYLHSTVFPKKLKSHEELLLPAFRELFARRRVWMWQGATVYAGKIIAEGRSSFKGNMGNCASEVHRLVREWEKSFATAPVTEDLVGQLEKWIEEFEQELQHKQITFSSTARSNLRTLVDSLSREAAKPQVAIPDSVSVTTEKIVAKLNERDNKSLVIVQAHDPDELREFAAVLGNHAYESRRRRGQITPLASFIFDEADEFIPGQPRGESYKKSKAVAMTLARRGRKFGMGIGIATQRIANLDVNTLAQPHTYFVSKLPRQYDRQTIASAFGISEEMFRQTFKFKKGDWLLASYDAAGLEAIPVPIHAENAEERILEFLAQLQ